MSSAEIGSAREIARDLRVLQRAAKSNGLQMLQYLLGMAIMEALDVEARGKVALLPAPDDADPVQSSTKARSDRSQRSRS